MTRRGDLNGLLCFWAERGPLKLDHDGTLWLDDGAVYRSLGRVTVVVPWDEVPDEHRAAAEDLLDLWRDALDPHELAAEAEHHYRRMQGS